MRGFSQSEQRLQNWQNWHQEVSRRENKKRKSEYCVCENLEWSQNDLPPFPRVNNHYNHCNSGISVEYYFVCILGKWLTFRIIIFYYFFQLGVRLENITTEMLNPVRSVHQTCIRTLLEPWNVNCVHSTRKLRKAVQDPYRSVFLSSLNNRSICNEHFLFTTRQSSCVTARAQ